MVVKVDGPVRVMVCLLELGVEFEVVPVDLQAGEQKQPHILARQPFGQVPAIEDGKFKLFESRAIVRYYAAKYAERGPNLLGKTLEDKALVDQWLEVESHNFNDLVFAIVLQLVILPSMGKTSDLALVRSCEEKLKKVFDVYEERLSKSTYLTGSYFSWADLSHLPAIRFLVDEFKMGHLVTERKNVNAWWKDISNRPAWKKLMKLLVDHLGHITPLVMSVLVSWLATGRSPWSYHTLHVFTRKIQPCVQQSIQNIIELPSS